MANAVSILTEGKILAEDLEKFVPSPTVDSRTFGPYSGSYYLQIKGWVSGFNGGDDSNADLAMYIDGVLVGSAHDHHFNTYNLEVVRTIRLQAFSSITVTITHSNDHGPTESGWSIDLMGWWGA